jgi:hypothetical protein
VRAAAALLAAADAVYMCRWMLQQVNPCRSLRVRLFVKACTGPASTSIHGVLVWQEVRWEQQLLDCKRSEQQQLHPYACSLEVKA